MPRRSLQRAGGQRADSSASGDGRYQVMAGTSEGLYQVMDYLGQHRGAWPCDGCIAAALGLKNRLR